MIKKLLIASAIFAVASSSFASTGFFGNGFIVLNLNNAGNTFYDLNPQTQTGNPDFNGTVLGTFNTSLGNSLVLTGGEFNTFQDNGDNVSAVTLEYSIYALPGTPSSFQPFNISFVSQSGNNDFWQTTNGSVDLLSGLQTGSYGFTVYAIATTTAGDRFYNNGGANYTANFNVVAPAAVPEPSTYAMFGIPAALGAMMFRRRRAAKA